MNVERADLGPKYRSARLESCRRHDSWRRNQNHEAAYTSKRIIFRSFSLEDPYLGDKRMLQRDSMDVLTKGDANDTEQRIRMIQPESDFTFSSNACATTI